LAATASFAQSTVTLRGNIDVGFTAAESNAVKTTSATSGLASTSKLIIEGTEDLGGGLKARFYTETGLAATTHLGTGYASATASASNNVNSEKTSTAIGDRGIFVGLMGGFGEVNAGRIPHQTGAFAIGMGGVQNAFSNAVGAGAAHPGQNSDVLLSSQDQGRANNSFLYTTPSFSGFTAKVQYSLGGGAGDGSQGNRTTLVANYTQGPVALEVMSSKRNGYDAAAASNTATGATPAQTGSYSVYNAGSEIKESALGAKYDLGVAAIGAGYAKQTSTTAAGVATTFRATGLGVTVPLDAWTLAAAWAKMTPTSGSADSYNATSFSAQYALSKRTSAYAALRANNQTSGKDKLTVVGLNHSF
jgi:predicted porin